MQINNANHNENVLASKALAGKQFHMHANAAAYAVLSDSLYSRKEEAVLREACVNALEAHQMVGRPDLPIDVLFPTVMDPTFYIKDYGPGLSHDEVMRLYGGYFESTKSKDNSMAGGFGLGAKSPFALTDSFTVISSHKGERRVYMAFKRAGIPNIELRDVDVIPEDDAWQHGLMVTFPIGKDHLAEMAAAAVRVFSWFPVAPNLMRCPQQVVPQEIRNLIGRLEFTVQVSADTFDPLADSSQMVSMPGVILRNGRVKAENSWRSAQSYVQVGPIAYPLDIAQLELPSHAEQVLSNRGYVFEVDIGAVAVAPSREALSYSKATKAFLRAAVLHALDYRAESALASLAGMTLVERVERIRAMEEEFGMQYQAEYYYKGVKQLYPAYLGGTAIAYNPVLAKLTAQLVRAELTRSRSVQLKQFTVMGTKYVGKPTLGFENKGRYGSSIQEYRVQGSESAQVLVANNLKHLTARIRQLCEAEVRATGRVSSFIVLSTKGGTEEDASALAEAMAWFASLGFSVVDAETLPLPEKTTAGVSVTGPRKKSEKTVTLAANDAGDVDVDIDEVTPRVYCRMDRGDAMVGVSPKASSRRDIATHLAELNRRYPQEFAALGLHTVFYVDSKVRARLERRAHWVELGDAIQQLLAQVNLLGDVRKENVVLSSGSVHNGNNGYLGSHWLLREYANNSELRPRLHRVLAGTWLLQVLEHYKAAGTPEKLRTAEALWWLSARGFITKHALYGASLTTRSVQRVVSRLYPVHDIIWARDSLPKIIENLAVWVKATGQVRSEGAAGFKLVA